MMELCIARSEHVNKTIASGNYVPISEISVDRVIDAGEKALQKAEDL